MATCIAAQNAILVVKFVEMQRHWGRPLSTRAAAAAWMPTRPIFIRTLS